MCVICGFLDPLGKCIFLGLLSIRFLAEPASLFCFVLQSRNLKDDCHFGHLERANVPEQETQVLLEIVYLLFSFSFTEGRSMNSSFREDVSIPRIWTVYEQFVASTLEIPVTFVMPESAMVSVQQEISRGEVGIQQITRSLRRVDSEHATAWKPEDERNVKDMIRSTVGCLGLNFKQRWF